MTDGAAREGLPLGDELCYSNLVLFSVVLDDQEGTVSRSCFDSSRQKAK